MSAFYNEIDRYCCDWLQNLMDAGHITAGKIDDRSIADLSPDDVRGYERVHFFAGIAGWDLAANLAGWHGPLWTGSCPCQPFSAAGKQRGSNDERHLWPAFYDLIRECRPPVVVGEQVAGAAGLAWLDHVCADLEESGYAVAAADLPACSVGAPHRRQRLFWTAKSGMADADTSIRRTNEIGRCSAVASTEWLSNNTPRSGPVGRMADDEARRRSEVDSLVRWRHEGSGAQGSERLEHRSGAGSMAYADNARLEGRRYDAGEHACQFAAGPASPWRDLQWLQCADGKARPTQPGLFPLAHGVPARVGRLRAYGNAIVPQVAAEFLAAVMECRP